MFLGNIHVFLYIYIQMRFEWLIYQPRGRQFSPSSQEHLIRIVVGNYYLVTFMLQKNNIRQLMYKTIGALVFIKFQQRIVTHNLALCYIAYY